MYRFMHRFGRRFGGGFGHRFVPEGQMVTLAQLKTGQSATVFEIKGGRRLADRLNSLGIIPGKKITKTSSMLMRGPVTIEVDRAEVAIGFGMANKIIVNPD
jgi:ferrous iron transport protein A